MLLHIEEAAEVDPPILDIPTVPATPVDVSAAEVLDPPPAVLPEVPKPPASGPPEIPQEPPNPAATVVQAPQNRPPAEPDPDQPHVASMKPTPEATPVSRTNLLGLAFIGDPPATGERRDTLDGGRFSKSADVVAIPLYRRNPEPPYPPSARRKKQQGLVLLTVVVSSEGHPESVALKTSSGVPALDQAARQAVEHWEFEPGRLGSAQVRSEIEVPVRFQLSQR